MVLKKQIFVASKDKMFCDRLNSELYSNKNQIYFAESIAEIADDVSSIRCDLVITELHKLEAELMGISSASERNRSIPIMILHEGLSVEEKMLFYRAGASVLLKKSTAVEICAAQAMALIRLQHENRSSGKPYSLIYGTELMINPRYRIVKIDGEILNLTKKEFDLLLCFVQNPKQVLDFEQLYQKVWEEGTEHSNYGTVKAHICTLRKKLSCAGKAYIQNIHGVGYRFVPPEY